MKENQTINTADEIIEDEFKDAIDYDYQDAIESFLIIN